MPPAPAVARFSLDLKGKSTVQYPKRVNSKQRGGCFILCATWKFGEQEEGRQWVTWMRWIQMQDVPRVAVCRLGSSLQWGWCIVSRVCKLYVSLFVCLFCSCFFLGSGDSFLPRKDNKSCCNSQWNSQQRKSQHQSTDEDFGLCEYSANPAYESYLNMRNVAVLLSMLWGITVLDVWASSIAFFKPGFCCVPAWQYPALLLLYACSFQLFLIY